ncbi:hypothetical protein JW859_00685 [bacterium]|nr:hypothetical protein [bacterium]
MISVLGAFDGLLMSLMYLAITSGFALLILGWKQAAGRAAETDQQAARNLKAVGAFNIVMGSILLIAGLWLLLEPPDWWAGPRY